VTIHQISSAEKTESGCRSFRASLEVQTESRFFKPIAPNTGLLEGMAGVAVPILDREGRAVAALSVGTISDRLNPERMPTVVSLLKREAEAIGPKIHPFDSTLRRPAQRLSGAAT
jgi:DNA-binding IclR family transcriptional regulator